MRARRIRVMPDGALMDDDVLDRYLAIKDREFQRRAEPMTGDRMTVVGSAGRWAYDGGAAPGAYARSEGRYSPAVT